MAEYGIDIRHKNDFDSIEAAKFTIFKLNDQDIEVCLPKFFQQLIYYFLNNSIN